MADVLARREMLAQAVLGALTTGCAPVPVERNRRADLDASEAPRLVVFDGGHTADQTDFGDTSYTMQLGIDGTVRAADDESLGAAVNALYVRVLLSLPDPTLGGLCENLRETAMDVRIAPVEESIGPLAEFTVNFEIDFRTPDGVPNPPA